MDDTLWRKPMTQLTIIKFNTTNHIEKMLIDYQCDASDYLGYELSIIRHTK